jgi:hypothetical protein
MNIDAETAVCWLDKFGDDHKLKPLCRLLYSRQKAAAVRPLLVAIRVVSINVRETNRQTPSQVIDGKGQ